MNTLQKLWNMIKKRPAFFVGIFVLGLLPTASFADGGFTPHALCSSNQTCTFDYFFQNIGMTVNQGMRILYIISALLGMAGIVTGLMKLRKHSTEGQSSGSLNQGVYALVGGGAFIAVPIITLLMTNTFMGNQNIQLVTEAQALNSQTLPPAHIQPATPVQFDPSAVKKVTQQTQPGK